MGKAKPKITEAERQLQWIRQSIEAIERAGYTPSVWFRTPLQTRCAILRECVGVAAYKLAGRLIMSGVSDRLRPTPEQMQHAQYKTRQVDKDGPRVAARQTVNILDMLQQRGSLTLQQARAGEAFAKDHRIIWGSPGARDSCIQRVGGEVHETEAQTETIVRAKQRTNRLLNRCGPMAYAIMVQVAVYEESLGKADRHTAQYRALRMGLDTAAEAYGIPAYDQGT